MNGLKYLVIVGAMLTIPCFAATKKVREVAMPETEVMEESIEVAPMSIPDCKLVQPVLKAGEVITQVEESCPPACFDIHKTIRATQRFTITGGCKKECVKCNEFGECSVVPSNACCKPVCRERCCPRPARRCCPRTRCCR